MVLGLIIIYVRIQPIIVSLSGYLALSGINLVILPRPGGTAPEWMADWGAGTSVFSPVLVIVILATVGWLLFARTAFFTHLRLMGSDERAAYTSGIPDHHRAPRRARDRRGSMPGLAAITFTSLIGSGDPSQGRTYTLIAVTAMVLGGTSLAGGRGGVMGSLFGAVNLYLITYVLATFNFGAVQSFVTDLSYGSILVISLLLTLVLPFIQRHVRNFSPLLYFVALSVVDARRHPAFYLRLCRPCQGWCRRGCAVRRRRGFHSVLEGVYVGQGAVRAGLFQPLGPGRRSAGAHSDPAARRRLPLEPGRRQPAIYLVIGALVLLVAYLLAFGSGHTVPLILSGRGAMTRRQPRRPFATVCWRG